MVGQTREHGARQRLAALRALTPGRGSVGYRGKRILVIPQFKSNKKSDIGSEAIKLEQSTLKDIFVSKT